MSDLIIEIENIFDEIDEDLQNDKENAMTIYDCFDLREEDKNNFIFAINNLIKCGIIYKENDKVCYNEICEKIIDEIIYNNITLAQMIIEELAEQKHIDFEKSMLLCDLIDKRFDEYKKAFKKTPIKDIEELNNLIENFNKNNMSAEELNERIMMRDNVAETS